MDDSATSEDTAIGTVWREQRPFLVELAFKMLGNFGDAEDVVQVAFTRLLDVDLDAIDDVRAWLVVVVSRLCLDDLRSARVRHQDLGADPDQAAILAPLAPDPADRVTLDDNVRMAMLVVLEQLSPAERTVFVLHDVFQYSFETAAGIVGRSPEACRQLASRARRRIDAQTGSGPARFVIEPEDQRRVAERFIAACAGGDLEQLMAVLDPDVVGVVDLGPDLVRPPQVGRDRVGRNLLRYFSGANAVTLVSHPIEGRAGALAFRDHELVAFVMLEIVDGLITDIHAIADASKFLR